MEVGKKVLKTVREACNLTEDDGYDSEMFYGAETSICKFIGNYSLPWNKIIHNNT